MPTLLCLGSHAASLGNFTTLIMSLSYLGVTTHPCRLPSPFECNHNNQNVETTRAFSMKGCGAPEYFLGMKISLTLDDGFWHQAGVHTRLSAETYIHDSMQKLAQLAGVDEFRKQWTPMSTPFKKIQEYLQTATVIRILYPSFQYLV